MLTKLRTFGAAHAIPLQVLAMVLALVQILTWVPLAFYLINKQDDLSRLLGQGPLSMWPWVLLWGAMLTDGALWVILRLLDADLNERGN